MRKGLALLQATTPRPPGACQLKHRRLFLGEQLQRREGLLPAPAPASALPLLTPRCCQIHDRCYDQAKKLDTCKFLLDNPYTKSYSYKCSGSEITCSSMFTPGWLVGSQWAGGNIIVVIATIC